MSYHTLLFLKQADTNQCSNDLQTVRKDTITNKEQIPKLSVTKKYLSVTTPSQLSTIEPDGTMPNVYNKSTVGHLLFLKSLFFY